MDFTSPKNMMTTLVEQTRLSLITLLRGTYSDLSQAEKLEDLLTECGIPELEQADIQDILQLIWKKWDDLKDNLFECHSRNGFGLRFRSYISLMINARNEWAHGYTFTYEEVLHNCFVVQHFFRGTKKQVDISIVDQIVDACFPETVVEKLSSYARVDLIGAIAEKEKIARVTLENFDGSKVVITSDFDECDKELDKFGQEVEGQEKGIIDEEGEDLIEETEEAEIEDDSEEVNVEEEESQIDPIVLKQLEVLEMIIEQNDYKKLAKMMGFKNQPEVSNGYYPDTLYLTAEGQIWGAFGYEKLKLIKDHLFYVAVFATYGLIPQQMYGEWEGNRVICLPNNTHSRVLFGRNKARMFCASMEKITRWLENYYDHP